MCVSATTEEKQRIFRSLLPLIITDQQISKPYHYIDLFAGPGYLLYEGKTIPGSPVIFLTWANFPYHAIFYEKNSATAEQLWQVTNGKATVIADSCQRGFARWLDEPHRKDAVGLIYSDPCRDEMPTGLFSRATELLPNIDILAHVSGTQYKRRRGLDPDRPRLVNHIEAIDKKTKMVRLPQGDQQWTFVFMTNRDDLPETEWNRHGFYNLDSTVGQHIMRVIDTSTQERKRKMSRITIERIGPDEAARYLDVMRPPEGGRYEFNGNRRIQPPRIAIYARMMATGHADEGGMWDPEIGNPITFNERGELSGGYHRLLAIIESGTTWNYPVKRGLRDDLVFALNEQRSGTAQDELRRRGWEPGYASLGASVARLLINFDNPVGSRRYSIHTAKTAAAYEIVERAEKYRELIEEASESAKDIYSRLHVNKTITAIAYVIFTERMGSTKTKDLFTKLATGIGLAADEPAAWLRAKMEKMQADKTEGLRMAGAGSNRMWIAFLIAGEAVAHEHPVSRKSMPRNPNGSDVRKYIWWDRA